MRRLRHKIQIFLKTSILPELTGKWYTKSDKIYAVSFDMNSNKEDSLESTKDDKITYVLLL